MRCNLIVRTTAVLLLATCWAAPAVRADDSSTGPRARLSTEEFEDTAVAALNGRVDAVQVAPAAQAVAAATSPAVAPAAPADAHAAASNSPTDPSIALPSASVEAQSADRQLDASPAAAADRTSRLAALKARLHQRMGADAEPPADEPPLPPPPGPVIRLRQPAGLQNMGVSLNGWLQQGISFSGDSTSGGFNGPVGTSDLNGEYQMNQFWLCLERPVANDGAGLSFGGRIDATFGTDWRWNINNGLENRLDGPDGQTYGVILPQAYAAVGYNELTVKLGTFCGLMDYETLPAPTNFFYSHSYCYTYGVPHQVTGMLADYRMDDNWSVQGGFHRGWSPLEEDNPSLDFLGGFRWQSADKQTVVSYTLSTGPQDLGTSENGFVYSLVVQEKLGARSEYVLVHDLGVENNATTSGSAGDWYGLNQYYIYTLTSQWAACLRGEWFRDQDGIVVTGPGNVPGVRAWAGHGFEGNFYEMTAGLNWRPQANITFRPEVRYDWYDGGSGGYGMSRQTGLPFNDGRSASQFLTAADLIFTF